MRLRNISKAAVKWCRRALTALALLFLFVTFTPAVEFPARWLAGPWADPKGQTLIVLGGSVLEDGTMGLSSYWRAVYAARAFRRDGFRCLLVTGGSRTTVPLAHVMRDFLVPLGVPESAVTTEARSSSTRENALFSAPLLAALPRPYVLMTSDIHMYRAHRVFAKAGIPVLPRPVPDALKRAGHWPQRWIVFLDILAETAKIFYYAARGWI